MKNTDKIITTSIIRESDTVRIDVLSKKIGSKNAVITKALDALELVQQLKQNPENEQEVLRQLIVL